MNLKEIRDIINLMNEHELSEIEIEREGTKIKIKKASDMMEINNRVPGKYQVLSQESAGSKAETKVVENNNRKEIKSPMVGTFYRAPSPESPSFVNVGDVVEVGQVVCIVEAMKLMNEIKSEVRGKIVEVLVENAQPVEFSQVLFAIEPV